MVAADRKIKRVYFPNSWYLGVYLKPFFSNYVDEKIKAKAKLWKLKKGNSNFEK